MCGPAIPVLKFIAPMILPSLANRLFGGNKQQGGDSQQQSVNARPATKMTGNQQFDADDQELKDETKAKRTEASKNRKLQRDRQKDPTATTQAGSTPQGSIGGNIAGDAANAGVPNIGGGAISY